VEPGERSAGWLQREAADAERLLLLAAALAMLAHGGLRMASRLEAALS